MLPPILKVLISLHNHISIFLKNAWLKKGFMIQFLPTKHEGKSFGAGDGVGGGRFWEKDKFLQLSLPWCPHMENDKSNTTHLLEFL